MISYHDSMVVMIIYDGMRYIFWAHILLSLVVL